MSDKKRCLICMAPTDGVVYRNTFSGEYADLCQKHGEEYDEGHKHNCSLCSQPAVFQMENLSKGQPGIIFLCLNHYDRCKEGIE